MNRILLALISLILISSEVRAQGTLSVMTYNVLNFAGSTPGRVSSFRIILDQFRPDILVVSEMLSSSNMNLFMDGALNHTTEEYSTGDFVQTRKMLLLK